MGNRAHKHLIHLLRGAFLVLALAIPAYSEVYRVEDLAGGLHDNVPSSFMADNEMAQQINLHSDVFSRGLIQRLGSRKQNSTQLTGKKSVDVFAYKQQDGDEFLLAISSKTWSYSSNNGANWTTISSTATDGAVYDCVGFIDDKEYCVSQQDGGLAFNGVVISTYGSIPSGKFIESYQNRLFVGNTAANPGRLFFSGLLQGTTWTTTTDYIDFPEPLTGIGEPFDNGLPIYTDNTVWMLRGNDSTNFYVQQISGKIGCANNRTIKNFKINGNEYQIFLSRGVNQSESNIYALDGVEIQPIGNKYLSLLSGINIGNSNGREMIWDTASDYTAMNLINLTTAAASGDLWMTDSPLIMKTQFNGNSTPNLESPAWTLTGTPDTASNSGGVFTYGQTSGTSSYKRTTGTDWGNLARSTAPYVISARIQMNSGSSSSGVFYIDFNDETYGNKITLRREPVGPTTYVQLLTPSNSLIGEYAIVDTSESLFHTYLIQRNGTQVRVQIDGVQIFNETRSDATANASTLEFGISDVNINNGIDFIGYIPQWTTASFTTQHVPVGSGTGVWGVVSINDAAPAGNTLGYDLISDSDTVTNVTDPTTFVSSQTIVNAQSPTISFSNYLVIHGTFTKIASSAQNNWPRLSNIGVTWSLNSGGQQPDSDIYSGNYWLTHTAGAESKNQSILVINRENSAYSMEYGTSSQHGFYGLAVSDGKLFGGDSNTNITDGGYVWWLENGNSDDGQAIISTATFKTNEFSEVQLDDYEKSLTAVYFNYGVDTGTFTATVFENFNEASTQYSVPFSSGTTINRYKLEPLQQTTAKQIGLRFVNSYPGSRLKLYPPITYHFDKVRLIPQQ